MDSKERIILKSLTLFNKEGFCNTSMRTLAKACKMSLSNLQYYFKNKEKLLESIFDEMCVVFDNTTNFKSKGASLTLLANMDTLWREFQHQYKFFFTEISAILQSHTSIQKKFIGIKKKRIHEYNLLFHAYAEVGIFRREPHSGFFYKQGELLWFTANFYLSSQLAEGKKYSEQTQFETNIMASNLIYPLLTEKGIQELMKLNYQRHD